MIYSMEKVPDMLQGWINKAVDFHFQKAHILVLKKGHGLFPSIPHSALHSTRDPDAMNVDFVCLKKLSPTECAQCMREGLCFRCQKKGHNADNCNQTQGQPKRNTCSQQVRTTETLSPTTATITPITPIDAYIQILATKGRTPEDILQTLKICYEDSGEDIAAATTFSSDEGF